jgi:hypothetical protein
VQTVCSNRARRGNPARRIYRLPEKEGPAEQVGKQIDQAVEKAGQQIEGR